MPLRIAFDLDGVLADMESALVRQAELLFGEALTRRLLERATDLEETAPATAADVGEDPKDDGAARRRRIAGVSLDR